MTTIGRPRRTRLAAVLLPTLAALPACTPSEGAEPAAGARRVGVVQGFHAPESVRYDPERDVFYVSNMYLYGSSKDDNGFIAEVSAADPRQGRILVQGGRGGATLHAPKGLALHGDTLWTADIDALRGFHRVTGAPLATIDFAPHGATLLNDVAVGPDGTIRVTDTGIVMSPAGTVYDTTGDRVFVVGRDRAITAIPAGMPYPKPNGITWDARGGRWLVATFDQFDSRVYAMRPGDTTRTPLARGSGQWDGVEALPDGRILVSSWSDSSVHVVADGRTEPLVRHVPRPADIGIDTKRGRLAIPLAMANRVELWTIPAARERSRGVGK